MSKKRHRKSNAPSTMQAPNTLISRDDGSSADTETNAEDLPLYVRALLFFCVGGCLLISLTLVTGIDIFEHSWKLQAVEILTPFVVLYALIRFRKQVREMLGPVLQRGVLVRDILEDSWPVWKTSFRDIGTAIRYGRLDD